jgi:DNA repair protein RadA/Sms
MVKIKSFFCSNCGNSTSKWSGRCGACGSWNSISEQIGLSSSFSKSSLGNQKGSKVKLTNLDTDEPTPIRTKSGVTELDRVLGGGLVPAMAILVGGDPGIGKSTLLLQAGASFTNNNLKTLYITGEEASEQIRMRAKRLGLNGAPIQLGAETNLRNILTTMAEEKPNLVIIDSIQTIWADTVESAPGSVSQVRASTHELTNFAKRNNISVVLVGHVTKEGQIAGPRVVEHMVDTVLYFEGERGHQFRILRAVKNRFGPADEIGVFEMTGKGLSEVTNPSALFLSERGEPSPGSVVFAGIEGTRPLLVELQALVAVTPHSQPRRAVIGWDSARLAMILAVLESRCNIPFIGHDVYLNVAGGMKISEPAADLAVATAILSALYNVSLPADTVVYGEISLSGAIRAVNQAENRLKEAKKLGFSKAMAPRHEKQIDVTDIEVAKVDNLMPFVLDLFEGK